MNEVVAIFLVAPLVVVPLGYRLLEVAAPGYAPPAVTRLGMIVAGALLALSFLFPAGLAALYAIPWLVLTGRDRADRRRPAPALARPVPTGTGRTRSSRPSPSSRSGAAFAFADRLGVQPFGFPADVITLTMVHFHFAGFALPLAGALAFTRRPHRWLEIATGAVIVGIPTTALGFFGFAAANWIGAVLTAARRVRDRPGDHRDRPDARDASGDRPGRRRRRQPPRLDAAGHRLRDRDAHRRRLAERRHDGRDPRDAERLRLRARGGRRVDARPARDGARSRRAPRRCRRPVAGRSARHGPHRRHRRPRHRVLGAVLGILATSLLAIEPEREAPVGGLFIGGGLGWLAISAPAGALRRRVRLPGPDALDRGVDRRLAIGVVLTVLAIRRRGGRDGGVDMRIAITGGTGFVGGRLAERLRAAGHEPVVVSRRTGCRCRRPGALVAASRLRGRRPLRRHQPRDRRPDLRRGPRPARPSSSRPGRRRRRIVMLSFLRARPDGPTSYHRSKWAAEEIVRASGSPTRSSRPASSTVAATTCSTT